MPEADQLFASALESELRAIEVLDQPNPLTFAVLHHSAAWLALECNDAGLAEELASTALVQAPPPRIARELRDVREQAKTSVSRPRVARHNTERKPHRAQRLGPEREAGHDS